LEYVRQIIGHALTDPDRVAVLNSSGQKMSYGELEDVSNKVASSLMRLTGNAGLSSDVPVVVYGHKDPLMVACFVGCLKSGHPYVPIDMHSVPLDRAVGIIEQIGGTVVLEVESLGGGLSKGESPLCTRLGASELAESCIHIDRNTLGLLLRDGVEPVDLDCQVSGEDLAYIIFTSGSTGAPKGVQITGSCFDHFCRWALTIGADLAPREDAVFLNQAPFSFDLSVYELAQSLYSGGTLFCLTKDVQDNARLLMEALGASGATVWVSTPSFSELCLANPEFGELLLPECRLFLFCGEPLRNSTVARLQERFPESLIANTYGPTESTVAVTSTIVSREMALSEMPLHCGTAKPGTAILIARDFCDDSFSFNEASCGELGEIVIVGDTVAKGYFGRDDLTCRSFGLVERDGVPLRAYRTGDEGFLDEAGNLHCRGRIDLQVKLNGYRIELGEIEEGLLRLPYVKEAVVVLRRKSDTSAHLEAFIVLNEGGPAGDFRTGLAIKEELKGFLPHYMIPKKISFREALPMTSNGKIDRKALA